jgi:hypothetical protein
MSGVEASCWFTLPMKPVILMAGRLKLSDSHHEEMTTDLNADLIIVSTVSCKHPNGASGLLYTG